MLAVEPRFIAAVMGGRKALGATVRSLADLEAAVARGLPRRALDACVARVWRDRKAADRLRFGLVPRATYHRRGALKPAESERIERLARVVALAESVWAGDAEGARTFLTAPHAMLDGRSPVAAARTELGARRVEGVLVAILHGLPV